ncbi:YvrJ family protein [Bacillus sp. HMF5848]|nr:YvrJ family protein [Bacillus sp. HMF5848]RSK26812.1 YvrJ family protein [Bacillus sp. HMF5848]
MEQWVTLISEVGFPIIVTLYLLHRIEAKLEVLIQSIQALPARIEQLGNK